MIQHFRGANGKMDEQRVAIVVSQYHQPITSALLEGAIATLTESGVSEDLIQVLWVPGAWEIPLAAKFVLEHERVHAAIGLGCVIRGETTHDQHINTTVANCLGSLALQYDSPVAFGVLTCNTMEQAVERAGGSVGNKGTEAAEAVIQMLRLKGEVAGT